MRGRSRRAAGASRCRRPGHRVAAGDPAAMLRSSRATRAGKRRGCGTPARGALRARGRSDSPRRAESSGPSRARTIGGSGRLRDAAPAAPRPASLGLCRRERELTRTARFPSLRRTRSSRPSLPRARSAGRGSSPAAQGRSLRTDPIQSTEPGCTERINCARQTTVATLGPAPARSWYVRTCPGVCASGSSRQSGAGRDSRPGARDDDPPRPSARAETSVRQG